MLRPGCIIILLFSIQAFAKVPDLAKLKLSVTQATQVMSSQDTFSERMASLANLKAIIEKTEANNSDSTMQAHKARNFYYALLPVLEIEKEKDCQTVANQVTQGKEPKKGSNEDLAMRLLSAICN